MKDYYEILGVARGANSEEIKRAYRKLAHQHHPDKKGGSDAKFKEINEAYQVLGDEQKRKRYDQFGTAEPGFGGRGGNTAEGEWNFNGGDFGDIFEELFSNFGGFGSAPRQQHRGGDIAIGIDVSFVESVFGNHRSVVIEKTSRCPKCNGTKAEAGTQIKTCDTCKGSGTIRENRKSIFGTFTSLAECSVCHGSGKIPEKSCKECRGNGTVRKQETIEIEIPPGIRDGEAIKLTGFGEAMAQGSAGDLYVRIHVLSHPVFHREGNDLVMDLDLAPSTLFKGGTHIIETLEGKLEVKIPELSRPGDFLRIRGKGVARTRGSLLRREGSRGDLLIRLVLKLPKKLSSHARKLLDDLEQEGL